MPAEEARVHATVVGETPYQETCIVINNLICVFNLNQGSHKRCLIIFLF
jgi:hypothetical protein